MTLTLTLTLTQIIGARPRARYVRMTVTEYYGHPSMRTDVLIDLEGTYYQVRVRVKVRVRV